MYFSFEFKVDDETLEMMKRRAVSLALEAKAAKDAYREALRNRWLCWLCDQTKQWVEPQSPVECVLTVKGQEREIRAYEVYIKHNNTPVVAFYYKTKSGKWGKTKYEAKLPAIIRAK